MAPHSTVAGRQPPRVPRREGQAASAGRRPLRMAVFRPRGPWRVRPFRLGTLSGVGVVLEWGALCKLVRGHTALTLTGQLA